MTKVAKRYGLSDVALAKTCRRHKIPRPPRGYWQKKRHGKRVRWQALKPLPIGEEESLGTVVLNGRRKPREQTGPVAEQICYEAEHRIVVPARLGRMHPLVEETRDYFRSRRKESWRYRETKPARYLDIHVERKALPRALRIMNTLIKALEKQGFSVSVETKREKPQTVVTVNGVKLRMRLQERRKQVKIPPSDRDLERAKTYPWFGKSRIELVYTGELALKIDDWWASSVRKTWADGKRQRVETSLNAFVVGLVRAAEAKRVWLEERERQQQMWEEQRQRLREEERRREEERLRGQRLERIADAWGKAREIRAYLTAVREKAEQDGGIEPGSDLAAWLAWAEGYAEAIDPLSVAEESPSI